MDQWDCMYNTIPKDNTHRSSAISLSARIEESLPLQKVTAGLD